MNKKNQGKKNRQAGQRFELKVRKDLESKGWIVSRWMNNVILPKDPCEVPIVTEKTTLKSLGKYNKAERYQGKLVSAKPKTLFINGKMIIINMWTGFPDFIAFRFYKNLPNILKKKKNKFIFNLIKVDGRDFRWQDIKIIGGIECKSNGYLDKEEKEKCKWLLGNNIFSKVLIASKGKKRGEINYKEV